MSVWPNSMAWPATASKRLKASPVASSVFGGAPNHRLLRRASMIRRCFSLRFQTTNSPHCSLTCVTYSIIFFSSILVSSRSYTRGCLRSGSVKAASERRRPPTQSPPRSSASSSRS